MVDSPRHHFFLILLFYLSLWCGVKGTVVEINTCQNIISKANTTYSFSSSLLYINTDCISIDNGYNITILGNGYSISAESSYTGIKILNSQFVSVFNLSISLFSNALHVQYCQNCLFSDIRITKLENYSNTIIVENSNSITFRRNQIDSLFFPHTIFKFTSTHNADFYDNIVQNITGIYGVLFFNLINSNKATIKNNVVRNIMAACPEFSNPTYFKVFDGSAVGEIEITDNSMYNFYEDNSCTSGNRIDVFSFDNSLNGNFNIRRNTMTNFTWEVDAFSRFKFAAVASSSTGGVLNLVDNAIDVHVYRITVWDITPTDINVTISGNQIKASATTHEMIVLNSENSVIFNNSLPTESWWNVDSLQSKCNTNNLVANGFSGLCYPPTMFPCCHNCVVDGSCISSVSSTSYTQGTCNSIMSVCTANSTHVDVSLDAFSNPYLIYDPLAEYIEPYITGPGLDQYFPNLKVFANGVEVLALWSGSDGAYRIRLENKDAAYYISISLDGIYSNSLPSSLLYITGFYDFNLQFYATSTKFYISWDNYTGTNLTLLHYEVIIDHVDINVLAQNVTQNFLVFSGPEEGEYYNFYITPIFSVGRGDTKVSSKQFISGPTTSDVGTPEEDSLHRIVYNEADNTIYAIGTTKGNYGTWTNAGAVGVTTDIIIAKILDNTTIPWAQWGTIDDDSVIDATLGSDGFIYVLTTNRVVRIGYSLSTLVINNRDILSSYSGSFILGGISQGPGNAIWVVGSTNGSLSSVVDGTWKAFAISVTMTTSLTAQDQRVWQVAGGPHTVVSSVYNKQHDILYITGYISGNIKGGFVSQLGNSGTPKSFVFQNIFNSVVGVEITDIDYNARRKMLAVSSGYSYGEVSFIPVDPITGLIPDYAGCFYAPNIVTTNFSIESMSVDICRIFCASHSKYSFVNSTACLCSNGIEDYSAVDESNCNVPCPQLNWQQCGSLNYYTVYTSTDKATFDYRRVITNGAGSAKRIKFSPSSSNEVFTIGSMNTGEAILSRLTDDIEQDVEVTKFEYTTIFNDVFVHPKSLALLLAGDTAVAIPGSTQPFMGGTDGIIHSFVPRYIPMSSGRVKFEYNDFTFLTIKWERPLPVADGVVITYRLTQQDQYYVTKVVYQGTDQSVTLPASGFDKYYILQSTGANFSTEATYFCARIVHFGKDLNTNSPPVVHFNVFSGKYLVSYKEEGNTMTIQVDGESGQIMAWKPALSQTSDLVGIVSLNSTTIIVGCKYGLSTVTPTYSNSINLNPNERITSIDSGLTNFVWVVGIVTDLNLPFLAQYEFNGGTLQLRFKTVFNYQLSESTSDKVLICAHKSKNMVFVVMSNHTEIQSNEVRVINLEGNGNKTLKTRPGAIPAGAILDEERGVLNLMCYTDVGDSKEYFVDALNITSGVISFGKYRSSGDNLIFAQSSAIGGGFYRPDIFNDDLNHGIYINYHDGLFWEQVAGSIYMGSKQGSLYKLSASSIDTSTDLGIAIVGQEIGGMLLGIEYDSGTAFYLLLSKEFRQLNSFILTSATFNSLSLGWRPPTGVLKSQEPLLTYKVRYNNGTGPWIETNLSYLENSITFGQLESSTTYYFKLTVYYNSSQIMGEKDAIGKTTSDRAAYGIADLQFNADLVVSSIDSNNYLHVFASKSQVGRIRRGMNHKRASSDSAYAIFSTNTLSLIDYSDNLPVPNSFVVAGTSVDFQGRLHVVGTADEIGVYCAFNNLVLLWCHNHSVSPSAFVAVAELPNNELLVFGDYGQITDRDLIWAIFDQNGNVLYNTTFGLPGAENALAVTYNSVYNVVYLVYQRSGLHIISFNVASRGYSSSHPLGNGIGFTALTFDKTRNEIVLLGVDNSLEGEPIMATYLVDSNGNPTETNRTTFSKSITLKTVTVDGNGQILVAGDVQGSVNGYMFSGIQDQFFGYANVLSTFVEYGNPYGIFDCVSTTSFVHVHNNNTFIVGTVTNYTDDIFYPSSIYIRKEVNNPPIIACTDPLICPCNVNQIKCKNGTCVNDLAQCIVLPTTTCPRERPYLCSNSTCVASYRDCTANITSCSAELCWDGVCELSESSCSFIPSCPLLMRRCPDGSCVESNVSCNRGTCSNSLCGDGSCPPCKPLYGCPALYPLLCPNGACVASEQQCRGNCSGTTFECYDGTCETDFNSCSVPPRLLKAVPFSYYLPYRNNTNQDEELVVKSLDTLLIEIADIHLPFSLFPISGPLKVLEVGPVPDSALFEVNGSAIFGNSSYTSNVLSTILSLSFQGSDISKFIENVRVTFINALPPNTNTSNLCMGFVNRTSNQWECESKIIVGNGTLEGTTSHFTEFAVLVGTVKAPQVNLIDKDDFDKLKDIDESTVALYVLCGIIGLYLVGLVFTIRTDRKNAIYSKMATSDSARSIAMSDLSRTDSSGSSTPSSPRTPNISRSLILRPEKDGIKDEKGDKVGFKRLMLTRLRLKHSWIAVLFSPPSAPFTRTNMLTLLLCMILANLVISATFYQYGAANIGLAQKVVNGIIVACCVFPITLILSLIFRKMPPKYFYISYIIAFVFCAICSIFTLVYALKFGKEAANAWLIAIAISTGQDGALNQPIKLLLSCFVILLFPVSFVSTLLL